MQHLLPLIATSQLTKLEQRHGLKLWRFFNQSALASARLSSSPMLLLPNFVLLLFQSFLTDLEVETYDLLTLCHAYNGRHQWIFAINAYGVR
jgi:hypothetical protein